MNAGAYGGELKDIIENVTFICPDGLIKTETADKLDFRLSVTVCLKTAVIPFYLVN